MTDTALRFLEVFLRAGEVTLSIVMAFIMFNGFMSLTYFFLPRKKEDDLRMAAKGVLAMTFLIAYLTLINWIL